MLQQQAININADSKGEKNPGKSVYEQDPTYICRNCESRTEQVRNSNVSFQMHPLQRCCMSYFVTVGK